MESKLKPTGNHLKNSVSDGITAVENIQQWESIPQSVIEAFGDEESI